MGKMPFRARRYILLDMIVPVRSASLLWDAVLLVGGIFACATARGDAASRPTTRPSDPDVIGSWRADDAARWKDKAAVETVDGRKAIRIKADGSGVELGSDAAFDFTADFTASLRVKLAGDQGAVYLLSKRGEDAADGWAIVHGIGGAGGVGGVGFVASPQVAVPTPIKALAEWVHVAVTFHERQLLLYVDGKAIGVTELPSVPLASKAPLVLGAGAGGKKPMDGWLTDVRIYHRALTEADVAALAAGKEPENPYVKLSADDEKRVRELIAELGADSFAQRARATERLRAMGRKIYPMLREYRETADLEVAARVKLILGELPRGEGEK